MAGVSTATVSRVINQTAWVEPVTRERVEKAMRDLNYRRNAAAIALAKRSGDMLGLLTGNLADPFFARLARGVEDVSRKQQYRLMVCSGGHDEEMEKAGLDFLVNQGCEAIVVHASRLPDKELLRYAAHFPALVVVNRYIAGMANRCIWLENRSAAREATRYLLANGHRRIACVTSDLPIIDRQERLDELALLVPAELFKDAYRRMGLDTKNLSRTIEDAGTVIEPLLPWTSAGVYMATTLGVSTLDLLPWAIQCYAAIFFALIYGFSGVGIARTASASEKSPQTSVTK